MGGKSGGSAQAAQQQVQPEIANLTFRSFLPGQRGLLADQLSAGFGAPRENNVGMLKDLHGRTNIPIVNGQIDLAALKSQVKE